MSEATGYQSRRQRKEIEEGPKHKQERVKPRFGVKAIVFTVLLPFLLLGWGIPNTFLYLCDGTCSYADKSSLAEFGMWSFFALSVACLLAILFFASESLTRQEKKAPSIVATAVSGLLTGFFFGGIFQDVFSSLVLKIMY